MTDKVPPAQCRHHLEQPFASCVVRCDSQKQDISRRILIPEPGDPARRTHTSLKGFLTCAILSQPTLRQTNSRDIPKSAMCIRKSSARRVLQFTPLNAASCVLHRPANRVIHRLQSYLTAFNSTSQFLAPLAADATPVKSLESARVWYEETRDTSEANPFRDTYSLTLASSRKQQLALGSSQHFGVAILSAITFFDDLSVHYFELPQINPLTSAALTISNGVHWGRLTTT